MADRTSGYKGVDLGTSRIVLAQGNDEEKFEFSSQLNAFVALPYSRLSQRMLKRENIPHAVEDNQIIAYGNRAEEFANLMDGEMRRPMQTGLLNPSEPKNLQMIELILREMCGEARRGEKICFSIPAAPPTNQDDLTYHDKAVTQVLENLGYKVKSLNEGLAVIYSELEEDNFTGIGISFGGGMCNVCVAYLGIPAISFSTVRGGDFIDKSAASVTSETVTTVRLHKEEDFSLNSSSENPVDQALEVYYNDVINTVVEGLHKALSETKKLPKLERPLPIVISGGTSMVGSFREQFEKAIRSKTYPMEISEVRQAFDPLNTTARGALMAAIIEM